MMKLIKLGAIMAFFIGGQALGQTSKISYTLELDGDNHAIGTPSWENPTACVPPAFTLGSTDDGQTYTAGDIVTWAARVFVTGTHSNGFAPSGAANVVANLELHEGSATGALVASFGHGGPSTTGFFSTINDGDGDGTRVSSCGFLADPLEDAAFPVAWDIDLNNPARARLIDNPDDKGPFLDYFLYPSDQGHPSGSTAVSGELLGIGAGYSKYAGYGCPSDCGNGFGLNTAGVGLTSAATCGVVLGSGPAFEGQLNTSGLADGTYVLVLVPSSGNNIVNGNFSCDTADPGAFALAPDLASEGDSITFTIGSGVLPPVPRTATAWRSIRAHSGCTQCELTIVLDPAKTGNGVSGPTVETRGPTVTAPGVQKVQVDFNGPVTLANAGNITVTYHQTTPGSPATMGGPIVTVPSSVTMADADTLNILFSAGQIPNMTCIIINLGAGTGTFTDGAADVDLQGDVDCKIRSLFCDVNGTGNVNVADPAAVKAQIGQPIASAIKFDVNLVGATITIGDQGATKAQIATPQKTALCP